MLSKRQKLACICLSGHLILAILSTSHISLPDLKFINIAVAAYREYSGSNYRWGFFAPTIGTQFRLKYKIEFTDGKYLNGQLGNRGPEEGIMRMQGIVSTFWFALKDKIVRRSLCASWASYLFNQYPLANKVTIVVDSFKIPSMSDFRLGTPGKWSPAYEGHFLKDTNVTKPQI